MNSPEHILRREETPVDDVRRVREQLCQEYDTIDKLAEHARSVTEQYLKKLNLTRVKPGTE